MRGIIAAVSPEGVIGVGNNLPWHYPADLKRFKRLTLGATVIMGRNTWESLPRRPLVGRRNLVVTSRSLPGAECHKSLEQALATCSGDVWFIGGHRLFAEAMGYADCIDLTLVPDHVDRPGVVLFPPIDPAQWTLAGDLVHEDDPRLRRRVYQRKIPPG